jgi:hypothetical protein
MATRQTMHALCLAVAAASVGVPSPASGQSCTDGSRITISGKIISVKPAKIGVLPALSVEGTACGEGYLIELIVEGNLSPNCQRGRNVRATGVIDLEDAPDMIMTARNVNCW